jgi:hypothetical protein
VKKAQENGKTLKQRIDTLISDLETVEGKAHHAPVRLVGGRSGIDHDTRPGSAGCVAGESAAVNPMTRRPHRALRANVDRSARAGPRASDTGPVKETAMNRTVVDERHVRCAVVRAEHVGAGEEAEHPRHHG